MHIFNSFFSAVDRLCICRTQGGVLMIFPDLLGGLDVGGINV